MTQEKPLVLAIRRAMRDAARLVIAFAGISGSGKTRTAIEFAFGLANYDADKIGFIDAENKRGSLYADCLDNHPKNPEKKRFWIGDLQPPFSPSRYAQAIKQFEDHGVEVLIIDSATHEWEGEGGAQQIAEDNATQWGKKDWAKAKDAHKKFMNTLLQCNMHVIVCVRAREKTKEEKNDKNKLVVTSLGIQPIQEKNFMFEMSASVMMWNEGQMQTAYKVPGELKPFLGRGEGYITSEDGYAVRKWVEGGNQIDQKVEKLRNKLVGETEAGEANLREKWGMLSDAQRTAVTEDFFETLLTSAREYDMQRADAADAKAGGAGVTDLTNSLADD